MTIRKVGAFDYDSHGDGYSNHPAAGRADRIRHRCRPRRGSNCARCWCWCRLVRTPRSLRPGGRAILSDAGPAPADLGTAVNAVAALPFDDDASDAAMASLTVHHWCNYSAWLRELQASRAAPWSYSPSIPKHSSSSGSTTTHLRSSRSSVRAFHLSSRSVMFSAVPSRMIRSRSASTAPMGSAKPLRPSREIPQPGGSTSPVRMGIRLCSR